MTWACGWTQTPGLGQTSLPREWQCLGLGEGDRTGCRSRELRPAPRPLAGAPPAPPAVTLHLDPGPRACAEAPFTLLAGTTGSVLPATLPGSRSSEHEPDATSSRKPSGSGHPFFSSEPSLLSLVEEDGEVWPAAAALAPWSGRPAHCCPSGRWAFSTGLSRRRGQELGDGGPVPALPHL